MLSDPEINFEAFWEMFDRNYGAFIPKRVDWKLLYKVYRPKVTPETTDDELFQIMADMETHLNDNHTKILSENPKRFFRSGILGDINRDETGNHIPVGYNIPDFSLSLIKEKYLKGTYEQRVVSNGISSDYGEKYPMYTFGWIADNIAYLQIRNFFEPDKTSAMIDEVVETFKDAGALILDVRGNGGGLDKVAKIIADRFADQRRLFMSSATRNGPKHDDFTPRRYWYVEPDGPNQFTKPVILLTHRMTISAGDCFVLAMKVLPHVINVGEATSGAYSDEYWDKLPNGWDICLIYKLYYDHEGRSWEGIGTPPDIRFTNRADDITRGHDKVLELAINIAETGPDIHQDTASSIQPGESLADTLEKSIKTIGIDESLTLFEKAGIDKQKKLSSIDLYYVNQEEMDSLGHKLLKAGKIKEAIAVFKLNVAEFPKSYAVYHSLAGAYKLNGQENLVKENYFQSSELNPKNYPWEKKHYAQAKKILEKQLK